MKNQKVLKSIKIVNLHRSRIEQYAEITAERKLKYSEMYAMPEDVHVDPSLPIGQTQSFADALQEAIAFNNGEIIKIPKDKLDDLVQENKDLKKENDELEEKVDELGEENDKLKDKVKGLIQTVLNPEHEDKTDHEVLSTLGVRELKAFAKKQSIKLTRNGNKEQVIKDIIIEMTKREGTADRSDEEE